jgi:hypothetical protein
MKRRLINTQISNANTFQMYLRQLLTLAENVFEFKDLPSYIDTSYMNKVLLHKGSIAFFYDDVLEEILALPYITIGKLDVYGRPINIKVIGKNGYNRTLKNGEFVIMYDNEGRYPLFLDILEYAERLALDTRTMDINIAQQKTPRFWNVPTNKEKTIKDLVNNVDGFENAIITYDDLQLNSTSLTLAPAPYVADKLDIHKTNVWNEFLRLIGVANLSYTKRERNISDEIMAMQGGTIASRYSRFEPRRKAVEEINKKWGLNIEIKYYDGIPTNNMYDDYKTYEENQENLYNLENEEGDSE